MRKRDPLALQAHQISNDGTRRVPAKRLADGAVAGDGSATFGFTADGSGSAAPTGMTWTSP